MPFVIAIYHQKGGVGKTTTALALGSCFMERGIRTLMVDLDPQANLTFNCGLDPKNITCSIADVLTGAVPPSQAVLPSNLPGLDIIPSNSSILDLGRRLDRIPDHEFLLRRALKGGGLEDYEIVWIDCPPSIGPLTINALTAADLLIVPTQCEYYSIQALADIFELVDDLRRRFNPPLAYRLLVTMYDGRGNFHANMLEQLREYFQDGLLRTTIGFDTKVREAQAAGLPITIHAPKSRAVSQYRKLAEELSAYVPQKPQI